MGLPMEPQLEDDKEEIDNDVADFLEWTQPSLGVSALISFYIVYNYRLTL